MLVADDEQLLRSVVIHTLKRRGHDVQGAEDAVGALDLTAGQEFDVVLVDANMPGNGLSVINHLHEKADFRGRLFLMTGSVDHINLPEGVTRIQKPFDFKALADLIARADA